MDWASGLSPRGRWALLALWLAVLAAMPIWMSFDAPGWDLRIYQSALKALAAGHDPYADAMAIQTAVHNHALQQAGTDPPYSYVYAPLTLPLLRAIAPIRAGLSGMVYWFLYLAGVLAEIWAGMRMVERRERRGFLYLAPVAAFFPGLLANGIVLSGNVAYLLYGAVVLAAAFGLRRDQWTLFYLCVLAASCVKLPLITLVAIPVLSARRQWVGAIATALAALAVFALQPLLWPVLFRHYLAAVDLQFSFNRDFGCSPAGLFSGFLYDHGHPYRWTGIAFHLCFAAPLFAALLYLSRCFLRGDFPLTRWLPVLYVGVILLNPRLIEYDVALLALPLALIGWRFLLVFCSPAKASLVAGLFFVTTNALALYNWNVRKIMDGPLLLLFFAAGAWTLLRMSAERTPAALQDSSRLMEVSL